MHQLVERSPTIFGISFRYGRRSRPTRALSRSSSRFGAVAPARVTRAPRASACAIARSPYQDGNEVERLGIGVLDPRALHERIEVVDVDEACAAVVGRGGDRPGQILLPELRSDEHDLPGLHVRTVNRELSEP